MAFSWRFVLGTFAFTRCSQVTWASFTWFLGSDIGKNISLLTSRQFRVSKENCYLPENIQKVRMSTNLGYLQV